MPMYTLDYDEGETISQYESLPELVEAFFQLFEQDCDKAQYWPAKECCSRHVITGVGKGSPEEVSDYFEATYEDKYLRDRDNWARGVTWWDFEMRNVDTEEEARELLLGWCRRTLT